jgi:hypothetical protein
MKGFGIFLSLAGVTIAMVAYNIAYGDPEADGARFFCGVGIVTLLLGLLVFGASRVKE